MFDKGHNELNLLGSAVSSLLLRRLNLVYMMKLGNFLTVKLLSALQFPIKTGPDHG